MMTQWHRRLSVATLVALCISIMVVLPLDAQIIIDPPPGGPPLPLPVMDEQVRIEHQQVDITVDGPLAQVQLTQRLHNDSPRTIEGSYVFPLPENAAIGDFQMMVNGEVIEGEILRKEEARQIYEEIVRRRRDPALLEYVGRDLFRINVFPIPAGETRQIELTYSQLLIRKDGLFQLRYPLETRQFSSAPIETLQVNISLINQPGLRTIYSPNFAIETTRLTDSRAKISYLATEYHPVGDFTLYFGTDESSIGVNLLSYAPAGEDGYFVLLAAPSLEHTTASVVQRDIVMVVDVSGSMGGEKIAQAIDALHYVVDQLNPEDRFNLIAFSTGVRLWQPSLQAVTSATQEAAHRWIDRLTANGSTDINRALLETLAQLDEASSLDATVQGESIDEKSRGTERPAYILFLTDGLPTQGERNPDRIIANVLQNSPEDKSLRLFNFGIGYDVNATLLDTLSGEFGGRSSYVRPNERIDEEVSHFYHGISTPVLSDVTVEIAQPLPSQTNPNDDTDADTLSTLTVDDLYPYPLPDLFAGEQLVVAGRYHWSSNSRDTNQIPIHIILRGEVNGKELIYHYTGQHVTTTGGEAHVARLWAARKIGAMLQQIRRQGPDQELIDAIVELSLQYGIVTPYTSAFVPEPTAQIIAEGVAEPLSMNDEHDRDLAIVANNSMVQDDSTSLAAPTADDTEKIAAATARVQQAVGADAVVMSETIGELQTSNIAQDSQNTKFVAGRTFVPQSVVLRDPNTPVTRWIDTRYDPDMQLQPVLFGSDCYFALLKVAQSATQEEPGKSLAAWLAVAPELIVVVDDDLALLITTELDAIQTAVCPNLPGIAD